jgi:hypothetical protein
VRLSCIEPLSVSDAESVSVSVPPVIGPPPASWLQETEFQVSLPVSLNVERFRPERTLLLASTVTVYDSLSVKVSDPACWSERLSELVAEPRLPVCVTVSTRVYVLEPARTLVSVWVPPVLPEGENLDDELAEPWSSSVHEMRSAESPVSWKL